MKYFLEFFLRMIATIIAIPFVACFSFMGLIAINFVAAILISVMLLKTAYNMLFK